MGKIKQLMIEEQDRIENLMTQSVSISGGIKMNEMNLTEQDSNSTPSKKNDASLYPDLSDLTTKKIPHRNLILDGVCSHCAHCGHELTDSVSIQRGIGPICSAKGYMEDAVEGDELQAMIDLAEYPELVQFLTEHYRPLGLRGLVNGLVRVASLNRPHGKGRSLGNTKVHAACCEAIESLGHEKLAKLLRESLAVVELKKSKTHLGSYEVWVRRSEWTREWSYDLNRKLVGTTYDKRLRAMIVPIHEPGYPNAPVLTGRVFTDPRTGRPMKETNKRALWTLMKDHYAGLVVKTPNGAMKIK
jgi:hypothetical protein